MKRMIKTSAAIVCSLSMAISLFTSVPVNASEIEETVLETQEESETETVLETEEESETEMVLETEEESETETVLETEMILKTEEESETDTVLETEEIIEELEEENVQDLGIKISSSNFPDANFRSSLKRNDIDSDGYLDQYELIYIKEDDVVLRGVTDYTGIELLSDYIRGLILNQCESSIDFSLLPKLESLSINQSNWNTVDVSKAVNLLGLTLSDLDITSLNLAKNTKLKTLYLTNVGISKLDISANKKIENLALRDLQLKVLDLSSNTVIRNLTLENLQLKTLNLDNQTNLARLVLDDCLDSSGNERNLNIISGWDISITSSSSSRKFSNLNLSNYPSLFEYVYVTPWDPDDGPAPLDLITLTGVKSVFLTAAQYKIALKMRKEDSTAFYEKYPSSLLKATQVAAKMEPLANFSSGVNVRWTKGRNVSGYYIYRSINNGTFEKIKTITNPDTVKWTDTGATKNGAKYKYKIVTYVKTASATIKSSACAPATIYRLSMPSLTSLTNVTGGKMKVKWTENAKATGYEIFYSTDPNFETNSRKYIVDGGENTYKTIINLKIGKTYYVKVRAIKKAGSVTSYSQYTSVKTVKIAK